MTAGLLINENATNGVVLTTTFMSVAPEWQSPDWYAPPLPVLPLCNG
jgi:hypothetical protein